MFNNNLLVFALKILTGIYLIHFFCCQREIKRETKGKVTTIYLHGNYVENCEFLVYVEKIGFLLLLYMFQIISKFTRN